MRIVAAAALPTASVAAVDGFQIMFAVVATPVRGRAVPICVPIVTVTVLPVIAIVALNRGRGHPVGLAAAAPGR